MSELELIAENRAGLPVLMRPPRGKSSDKASFQEVITRHPGHLQGAGVQVLAMILEDELGARLELLGPAYSEA